VKKSRNPRLRTPRCAEFVRIAHFCRMGIFCNCCLGTFLSFEHISRCAADRLRRGKTLCLRRTGPRPDPRCRHSRCRVSGQTKRTPPPQRETASAGVYMGLGEGLRIPDPRRGAAGQQTGSSPAIATSRISGPAGRSSQRRKASLSRLRSRKASAAIISRLYNSTP
jgi:hypothetical protein